ncbi:AraC family transcriptional regulator [Comamonas sp. Y33R10-2]|uniref:AraC family transcriptional regulator n=1 Tax=Comamonas sp. Y33R10-2 TaxID=2853257 RepID=UPI001C5C8539|nr:AraC family transcriptional regulator [Comamonas sp. Y33R10-2]QXZ09650.1 AraC family transcriptional regulator [Comamonas sp. Y33R10-2]
MSDPSHQFHRHPSLPFAELRISRQSCYSYRLHAHAQYSIGIVDEGETLFVHNQGTAVLKVGRVVLLEPEHWHACNPETSQPWSYRMLFVQADWVHQQLGVPSLRFAKHAPSDPEASRWVDQLCRPLASNADPSKTQAYIQSLTDFLRLLGSSAPACGDPPHAVLPALQQLHSNPEADTSLQALALQCGMSPSRFSHRFKAATGVTPGSYRLNLRLNAARHLLAQGQSLAAVAQQMGFADQAHMQRAFKAHHALTPGNYAQANH